MRVGWSPTTLSILSLIGLVAATLGYLDFRKGGSLCPSSGVIDCSRVYAIPQAKILGVHLSELALAYFLVLAILALLILASGRRELLLAHLVLSTTGLSIVPYLVYLELAVAGSICLYCTIMHLAIVGCTVNSALLWAHS